MLSYSRRDERAGKTAVWWVANSWNRTVNYACFGLALSLQSERCFSSAEKEKKQKGEDTRGRQFVHICSLLHQPSSGFWIFAVMGPPEHGTDRSIHSDQYEIIHKIRRIKLTSSQECLNNIHDKFMGVIEGIYSEFSFRLGLIYIGCFHICSAC